MTPLGAILFAMGVVIRPVSDVPHTDADQRTCAAQWITAALTCGLTRQRL
jgi:hypothetical protein